MMGRAIHRCRFTSFKNRIYNKMTPESELVFGAPASDKYGWFSLNRLTMTCRVRSQVTHLFLYSNNGTNVEDITDDIHQRHDE